MFSINFYSLLAVAPVDFLSTSLLYSDLVQLQITKNRTNNSGLNKKELCVFLTKEVWKAIAGQIHPVLCSYLTFHQGSWCSTILTWLLSPGLSHGHRTTVTAEDDTCVFKEKKKKKMGVCIWEQSFLRNHHRLCFYIRFLGQTSVTQVQGSLGKQVFR